MRLYSGSSRDFIELSVRNQIAEKLKAAFFNYYRYNPSPAEMNSWRNSLRAVSQVFEHSGLLDHGVLLEYQLPMSSKRLDCMICGEDANRKENAVIVELKQWDGADEIDGDGIVQTWVGGQKRPVLHPSVQVGQYRQYLSDTHTAFHMGDPPISLSSCAYLHNYFLQPNDPILHPKFTQHLTSDPIFDGDAVNRFSNYLLGQLSDGRGLPILRKIEQSKYRPSRKLMDYVAQTIEGRPPWILLDEQLVVFETVKSLVKTALFGRKKQVVIIRGGPGTGKSVLAINLMSTFLKEGRPVHYATGSKAFTETLWEIVGRRSQPVFRYFNNYMNAEYDDLDVLICDESHRIRENSNTRFTPKHRRSTKPQVREILEAAKVSIFFIDDKQGVRPNEIGSSEYIRTHAQELGASVSEHELEIQFRCAGSDGFINWINNTLGIQRTANVIWDGSDQFDFKILDSPERLEQAIRKKSEEGNSARVAAGFCWPWSEPRSDGTLVDDVVVGDYRRPWDAKPGNWKLAPGIPPAALWATDPNGINQIGCVYNIQGFELDYIGVIWGKDLVYSFDKQGWIGDKGESADSVVKRSRDKFVELVKNTYRVLLTRGMKGCYIYFMDKDTERFIRSRMEQPPADNLRLVAEPALPYD